MSKRLLPLIVLLMVLAACTGDAATTGDDGGVATPESTIVPTAAADATATEPPRGLPGEGSNLMDTLSGESATIAKSALAGLVEQSGLAADELSLMQMDEVVWPDSAIGCPKEGEMALMVLTPGYRLIFSDGAGERYFVHTNKDATNVVICDQEVPLPDNPNPDS